LPHDCRILVVNPSVETAEQLHRIAPRLAASPQEHRPRLVFEQATGGQAFSDAARLLREAVPAFGLLVVEIAAGDEAADRGLDELVKIVDPSLQMIVLTGSNDVASRRLGRMAGEWRRLLVLSLPRNDDELVQLLPLLAAKWQQERAAFASAAPPSPGREPALKEPSQNDRHILVVDDDEMIGQIMMQVLVAHHHKVLIAHNADKAWSIWRRHRDSILLVITDVNMPGGANGFELARAIHEDHPGMPVIYTSGQRASAANPALQSGVNYLPKPFGMSDLIRIIQLNLAGD
jgi:CheY-like chemotaxis protein